MQALIPSVTRYLTLLWIWYAVNVTDNSREELPATILHHLLALLDYINPFPKLTQTLRLVVSPGVQNTPHAALSPEHFWVLHLYKPPASCSMCNFYLLMHRGRKDAEKQPSLHILWTIVLICLLAESMLGPGTENTYLLFSFLAERSGLLHKAAEICIDLFWQGEKCF